MEEIKRKQMLVKLAGMNKTEPPYLPDRELEKVELYLSNYNSFKIYIEDEGKRWMFEDQQIKILKYYNWLETHN